MHLLSIESSTRRLSIALLTDGVLVKSSSVKAEGVLESSMLKTIDRLLVSAQVPFKRIDALAVGLGPGSFTGLRVGLATVKAFALASSKKLIGVCSLDVIAAGVLPEVKKLKADEICVLLDARRSKVYAAVYDSKARLKSGYALTTLDEALKQVKGRTLFVGDGLSLYKEEILQAYKDVGIDTCEALFAKEKSWLPQAGILAELAYARARRKEYDDAACLSPIYLYAENCQVRIGAVS